MTPSSANMVTPFISNRTSAARPKRASHRNMIAKPTLLLLCFLAPLLAAAGPPDALDVYASLTEKTLLMPFNLPFLSDPIISDLPTEKTNAIARIESEFAKQGIAVTHD